MDAYKLRGASPIKLARWLAGIRCRLAWHEHLEPLYQDARDWVRRERAEERMRLVAGLEKLEGEVRRRAGIPETVPRT